MEYYITDFNVSNPNAAALEDGIMKKGSLTTAGSKMLSRFAALFDAGVVERLMGSGVEISGKTKMKEFGMPDFFADPNDGALSGSAQAVMNNAAAYCLCNDLFGQYRREAAENRLCYLHPTYGTVSRYGLIPLAASMDQIGILCKNANDGFALLAKISGNDARDGAMFPEKAYSYEKRGKKMRLRVPGNILRLADEGTREAVNDFAGKFEARDESNLEHFGVISPVMYILTCAEISNNLSRYDGVKFGYRAPGAENLESLYVKTRTEAFGMEAKLAAMMGAA
ncbi:MAG: hypothetical protein LBR83_08175, partial [Clostridiales bacterium]|nr:hypothetical protein [Clostridiales bacterium]